MSEMSVRVVDHMGSDLTVVNAARVSFGKTVSEMSEKDTKLIRYLAKHGHWSPFGHCSVQFHIKAPVFVARQLVKHQIGLTWNEISRRYVDTEVEFYDVEGELAQGSGINDENYSLKKFVEKDPKSKVNKYKIKTTTFDKIIPSNKTIDYLSIDLEGNEMDILETIDFTKYTIKVISVENNKPDEINFNSFFKKKNFSFFDRIGVDEVFFNNSYFKFD